MHLQIKKICLQRYIFWKKRNKQFTTKVFSIVCVILFKSILVENLEISFHLVGQLRSCFNENDRHERGITSFVGLREVLKTFRQLALLAGRKLSVIRAEIENRKGARWKCLLRDRVDQNQMSLGDRCYFHERRIMGRSRNAQLAEMGR